MEQNILSSILAQEAEFGWLLSGPITHPSRISSVISFHNKMNSECLLTRFWEVGEIPKEPIIWISDKIREEFFQKTTLPNSYEHYQKMPIILLIIGHFRRIALAQFLINERS